MIIDHKPWTRQDLVKNLTSGQSAAPDVERHFLDDLVKEMSMFRVAFEQLMGLLATFKGAEASTLLDAALKKMDAMNATVALYEDVRTPPFGSATACVSRTRSQRDCVLASLCCTQSDVESFALDTRLWRCGRVSSTRLQKSAVEVNAL